MIERVVVLHRGPPRGNLQGGSAVADSSADARAPWPTGGLLWATCLRTIWIGVASPYEDFSAHAESGRELYRGAEAYRFLLEVACGLHSPLLGETEVMGQFKAVLKRVDDELADPLAAYELRATLGAILADAKAVRRDHLVNLGSQSYGSLARKYLRGAGAVHLLGAGALVEELLPWMKTFPEVSVFSRGSRAAAMLAKKFPDVVFTTFDAGSAHAHPRLAEAEEKGGRSALVIAATMSADSIAKWIDAHAHPFDVVIDLRGAADSDPLRLPGVVRLAEFFSGVSANLESIREKTARAHAAIGELSRAKESAREIRPFGWDDLCA